MRTEMERLFDRFGFGMPAFRRWFDPEPSFRSGMTMPMPNPAIDIAEDDREFTEIAGGGRAIAEDRSQSRRLTIISTGRR